MQERTSGFAVATPHAAATAEAARIFRHGGNAVDAALAACAVLTVVYPHMTTIGGDLFALIRRPSGVLRGFNGSGAAPRRIDPEDLRRRYGQMPIEGPDTVTVPGVIDAWFELSRQEGRLAFSELLESAIRFAREGCEVTSSLARAIEAREDGLRDDEGMRSVFVPRGTPLSEGDTLVQPALGETLQRIAQRGATEFYAGDVGRRFAQALARRGSPLDPEDLQEHATEVVSPLTARFRDWNVVTMPPNSQGYALLEILAVVDRLGLDLDALGSEAGVLAHLFRLVAEDRDRYLADPRQIEVPVEGLLSEGHIASVAEASLRPRLDAKSTSIAQHASAPRGKNGPSGDTVACVTADGQGGAASIIQSVFHSFGSGIMDPSTGIIAQNRGACFNLHSTSPNVIAGGKRSLHTLMPVMVERSGALAVVAGTMGGRAQPQIHAQILGRVFRGQSPEEAVSRPRWVVGSLEAGGLADVIFAEAAALGSCGEALKSSGMDVQVMDDVDEQVGHAQYICVEANGVLTAAADPRSDGTAEPAT